jgi:radical SAM superfamily enzyme YgiQ (UPF0313 family)
VTAKSTTSQASTSRPRARGLREPGAVLLVSCYELGHQPLNLAFPLSYLQRAGYQPLAVDTSVDPLPPSVVRSARLVAISVPMHTALRLGTRVARRVREINPDAVICFYGLYAWLNAGYLLRECGDFVIGGEYEQPLLQLIQRLETGSGDPLGGVSEPGIANGPSIARIDFPEPDRSTLPSLTRYAHLLIDGRAVPAGYTETTRGCRHTCLHCPVVPVYRGRFFAIPREIVMNDIRRQVEQGAGHITFGDPDFLNGPTHALRVCRQLHEEFSHVTFDMTTRIEHIIEHREHFPEFQRLGCVFVVSAVEAVSEVILQKIDKGHTRDNVVEALGILDGAGIAMRPSLLPFTPWTSIDDYLELLEFAEAHDLIENIDPVHFSIRLLVPPGSALLDDPDASGWVGDLDEEAYTYEWRNPDPRVDQLQRDIAALVEAAADCETDPYETFEQIKHLAYRAKGVEPPRRESPPRQWKRPPRLTESWFC